MQACSDAHLANFGVYASPERQLVFDIIDFDRDASRAMGVDVKRLAASFMITCRQRRIRQGRLRVDHGACGSGIPYGGGGKRRRCVPSTSLA